MAAQLWMLRHGEAVPHDSKPDAERELTPRGRTQAETAGVALAALGVELDACYASPKVRAWETARLACQALGVEPVREDALANGFNRVDALTLLEAHGEARGSSSSATSRRSRRSSTTSPAAGWTSRRAPSPPWTPGAPQDTCW